jgi:hypothetical protein
MRKKRRPYIKSVQRRLQIEAMLADYPSVSPDKIIDVIYWFKREATAMEVASVASNPDLQKSYRSFRDRHLGKLSMSELIVAIGVGMVLIVTIAAVVAVP